MNNLEKRTAPGPRTLAGEADPGTKATVNETAGKASLQAIAETVPPLVRAARDLESAGKPAGDAWHAAALAVRRYCELTGRWPAELVA